VAIAESNGSRPGTIPVRPLDGHRLERPVIVTVVAVGVMEVALDQVVDVVTMWNRRVTAVGAVDVPYLMPVAVMVVGWGSPRSEAAPG